MKKSHLKKILAMQVRESAKLGRVDEIRELLLQMLQLYPDDEELKAELSRLNRGVKLKMAQSSKELASPSNASLLSQQEEEKLIPTEIEQIKESVFKLIRRHKADNEKIRHSTRPRLRRRQRYVDTYLRNKQIPWTPQEREDIETFQRDINEEFVRRSKERNLLILSSCALLIVSIIGLFALILHKAATRADISLRDALIQQNKYDVQSALHKAERPLYLYLYPQLATSIQLAQDWMEEQQASYKLILELEDGTRDISTLNPSEYTAIRLLGQSHDLNDKILFNRWENFKQSQLSAQEKVKVEKLTQLIATIPAEASLSDTFEHDRTQLLNEQSALAVCLNAFKKQQKELGLDKDYTQKLDARLKKIEMLLNDISEMEQLATKAKNATSYKQYLEILQGLKGKNYPFSINIAHLASKLPSLEQLNALMRYTSTDESSDIIKMMEASLLEDKSSFTPSYPANAHQVGIMEQIFRSNSLNTPLYQLKSPLDGTAWLSELAPSETEKYITLTRTAMDPLHATGDSRSVKVEKKLGMELKQINALPLIEACDIKADSFFRDTQLPNKLTEVLQYQDPNYPILAQAFIYQQILKTMELHQWPKLMGFTFSSQLRADQKSFKKLVRNFGFTLDGESWLMITPLHIRAEKKMREWFNKNHLHNYGLDIKRVLRRVLFVRIRYAGYINKEGQSILIDKIPDNTPVWYVDKELGELQVGNIEDIKDAAIYSPILYSDPLAKENEQGQ